jgi:hypothetical protein
MPRFALTVIIFNDIYMNIGPSRKEKKKNNSITYIGI